MVMTDQGLFTCSFYHKKKAKVIDMQKNITLLLPFYLDEGFKSIFEELGYTTFWSDDPDEYPDFIRNNKIDIAFEWQHGLRDFPIRNLLFKYGKKVPIILFLNLSGKLPEDFDELGYVDNLNVPPTLKEIEEKIFSALRME